MDGITGSQFRLLDQSNSTKTSASMVGRRFACSFSVILLLTCFIGVYYTYFKRPPTEELMRMNDRRISLHTGAMADFNDTKDDTPTAEVDQGLFVWQDFVRKNNLVSVGEVWDRGCDEKGRKKIGAVVMMPDDETGGVKTRTFINYTLCDDLVEGEFYMEVKYNKNNLFDNHWDLCTVEEDIDPEERTIFCPVKKGFKSEIKDRKIPSYLPKGEYYTRSWITNQNGLTVMCGYSDFIL